MSTNTFFLTLIRPISTSLGLKGRTKKILFWRTEFKDSDECQFCNSERGGGRGNFLCKIWNFKSYLYWKWKCDRQVVIHHRPRWVGRWRCCCWSPPASVPRPAVFCWRDPKFCWRAATKRFAFPLKTTANLCLPSTSSHGTPTRRFTPLSDIKSKVISTNHFSSHLSMLMRCRVLNIAFRIASRWGLLRDS